MINAILLLLSFQLVGEVIIRLLSLPVPGPVVGMLLLFATLLLRDNLADRIEQTTQYILQNLTLLYVPAAVGVIVHLELMTNEGLPLIITLVGSALITIALTGLSLTFLRSRFKIQSAGKEG